MSSRGFCCRNERTQKIKSNLLAIPTQLLHRIPLGFDGCPMMAFPGNTDNYINKIYGASGKKKKKNPKAQDTIQNYKLRYREI